MSTSEMSIPKDGWMFMSADQLKPRECVLPYDETVEGVGRAALIGIFYTRDENTESGHREHQLLRVPVNGYPNNILMTEPVPGIESGVTVVTKPGWTEQIEKGVGFKFHTELARKLPGERVVSHATHGIGPYSERISLLNLPQHGLDRMADDSLKMMEAYFKNMQIVMVGISMGTVIANKVLNLNTDAGFPIEVNGVIHFASALVDPVNALKNMGGKFLATIGIDVGRELALRTKLQHVAKTTKILWGSRPSLSDVPSLGRQGIDLLHGTSESSIERTLENYAIAVITGDRDPICEIPMWQRLAEKYPNLWLEIIQGKGHEIAVNPYDSSRKVANTIVAMGLNEPALEAIPVEA